MIFGYLGHGDWRTAALDPGAWYNTVQEGGCRFMAAWVREEENASNQRQKKREAEEADKVEVAPGVTVASLRRFRTALIGPTQGLPKSTECGRCYAFWGAWLRAGEGIGWLAAGTMPNSLYRMHLVYLFLACVFCYSCSFLFVVFCVFVFFFFSHRSLVNVPLIFFCPADHVPDWQPRSILLGMVEARSVDVKKTSSMERGTQFFPLASYRLV